MVLAHLAGRRSLVAATLVGVFLLAACSGDSKSSSTDAGADTTAAVDGGDATTTVAAPPDSTTAGPDTTAGATETPSTDPNSLAEARVQAALDSLPPDYSGSIASDLGEEGDEGDDIVFSSCVGPDEYNLDNLDADSAASWELGVQGPETGSPFGGSEASFEARVFASETTTPTAFAVLEKVLGTDEGRDCLASVTPAQLAADAPEDTTFEVRVEGTTIEGADVGARLIVTFNTQGVVGEIYVDLVATQIDATGTIFASFVSFAIPFDQAVASAMVQAAVAVTG